VVQLQQGFVGSKHRVPDDLCTMAAGGFYQASLGRGKHLLGGGSGAVDRRAVGQSSRASQRRWLHRVVMVDSAELVNRPWHKTDRRVCLNLWSRVPVWKRGGYE
jgi:hypothetical protein